MRPGFCFSRKSGGGYINYLWPKPTARGLSEDLPKLSYVRLYEPLGWIVGTGVYTDMIDKAITEKTASMYKQIFQLGGMSLSPNRRSMSRVTSDGFSTPLAAKAA